MRLDCVVVLFTRELDMSEYGFDFMMQLQEFAKKENIPLLPQLTSVAPSLEAFKIDYLIPAVTATLTPKSN